MVQKIVIDQGEQIYIGAYDPKSNLNMKFVQCTNNTKTPKQ